METCFCGRLRQMNKHLHFKVLFPQHKELQDKYVLFTNYIYDGEIKEDEICTQNSTRTAEGKIPLGRHGVDDNIILK
jgi:hypothetical protein